MAEPKRFPSKVDLWIRILLILIVVLEFYVLARTFAEGTTMTTRYIVVSATVLVVALVLSLLFRTHYTISGDNLRIVSGPFFRNISISSISSVEATRSPISSPALSLDRIRIRYGNRRSVMVSPEDKSGFLKAIGHSLE